MSNPKHQKSIRLKPEHYDAINDMMNEENLTFQAIIDRMLDDSFAIFEKKVEKLRQESAAQIEALQKSLEAENQRLTAKIDELTENEKAQTAALAELTEFFNLKTNELDDLTVKHEAATGTLENLKSNYLSIPFTEEQREVIQEVWQIFQDNGTDEEWQTPVHLIFDAVVYAFKEWDDVPYDKKTISEIFQYPPALQGPDGETDTNENDGNDDNANQ